MTNLFGFVLPSPSSLLWLFWIPAVNSWLALAPLLLHVSPAPALISLPSLQIRGILFVFGHWKITVSCLENTQITITSLFSGLSKFHQQPLPQRVNVGGAARFECQIEGVPTPVITWEKDKVAVPEETRWALGGCFIFFLFGFRFVYGSHWF